MKPWLKNSSVESANVNILSELLLTKKKNFDFNFECSTALRLRVFFGKNIEKKHLSRHDKNYYYFCISNIRVMNLSVGSRNMIKVSNKTSL